MENRVRAGGTRKGEVEKKGVESEEEKLRGEEGQDPTSGQE